jgi:signal transduction histidine kinase
MSVRRRFLALAARPHLPRRTVRVRLTLLYGGLFLVCGVVLLAVTYVLVRNATDGVYVYRDDNGITGAVVNADGSSRHHPSVANAEFTDEGGTPRMVPPAQAKAEARRLEALAKHQHDDQMHELLAQSAIALGVTTVVSLVLGWFVAGRVLRPVRTITSATRTISATNLHERLALDGPRDELRELGDTIDGLLARLERAFDAQRQFVANASHELRTPLARQRTVAQVALDDPDATIESLRAAHERVLAAGRQQERLIDALLTLTRGQAGLAQREQFDLASLTDDIVHDRMPDAEAMHVHLDATLEPAPTTGDHDLAGQLIANLVDNAIRHNRPGGRIDISTGTSNGHAILAVSNDGALVPASELPRLFEPLERLESTRTSIGNGYGLGLSIVRAISDAHDAIVTTHARPEGGLAIAVRFAAATHDGELVPVAS